VYEDGALATHTGLVFGMMFVMQWCLIFAKCLVLLHNLNAVSAKMYKCTCN